MRPWYNAAYSQCGHLIQHLYMAQAAIITYVHPVIPKCSKVHVHVTVMHTIYYLHNYMM